MDRKKIIMMLVLCLILCVIVSPVVSGADSAPGSEQDPLVSKSYVDSLIKDLRESLEEKLDALTGEENEEPSEPEDPGYTQAEETSSSFKVVEVPADTKVIGGEGTEMIVRSGYAFAIDNGVDGISDLTAGADLKGGTAISKNHLLLIPRSDGRGISCQGLCYVMIKGEYTFE